MKKKTIKHFKAIASTLPVCFYKRNVVQIISGDVLINKHDIKALKSGEIVKQNKKYTTSEDAAFPIDHTQRLKKAFKRNGGEGVNHYIHNEVPKLYATSLAQFEELTNKYNQKKAK